MDKTTLKLVAASVLILAGTGVAMARDHGEGGPRMTFEELDVDGSGEVTPEDLAMLADQRFADLDADGNGSVSQDEYVAAAMARASERAARMFDRLDADGDGALSRDVLENRGGRQFGERMISRFDADDSGGVSAEEFETVKERMANRRQHRKGGGDRGWGRSHN